MQEEQLLQRCESNVAGPRTRLLQPGRNEATDLHHQRVKAGPVQPITVEAKV